MLTNHLGYVLTNDCLNYQKMYTISFYVRHTVITTTINNVPIKDYNVRSMCCSRLISTALNYSFSNYNRKSNILQGLYILGKIYVLFYLRTVLKLYIYFIIITNLRIFRSKTFSGSIHISILDINVLTKGTSQVLEFQVKLL